MGRLVLAPLVAAALALVATALLPCSASAKNGGVAPPGNSGVSQYMEDIPTVHGNKPTTGVVIPPRGGGSGGESSNGSASSKGSARSTIPNAVAKQLDESGSNGQAAAAVAEATATPPVTKHRVRKPGKAASPAQPTGVTTAKKARSPTASVLKALSGSTGGGGLGGFLPVLLVAALIFLSAAGIFHRRGTT
jgi:hypothetical protein